jgi:hypothetical protein
MDLTFIVLKVRYNAPVNCACQGPRKVLVHVKAWLQPSGRRDLEVIEATTIAVINGELAARAQAATAAYRANAIEARKKQELKTRSSSRQQSLDQAEIQLVSRGCDERCRRVALRLLI